MKTFQNDIPSRMLESLSRPFKNPRSFNGQIVEPNSSFYNQPSRNEHLCQGYQVYSNSGPFSNNYQLSFYSSKHSIPSIAAEPSKNYDISAIYCEKSNYSNDSNKNKANFFEDEIIKFGFSCALMKASEKNIESDAIALENVRMICRFGNERSENIDVDDIYFSKISDKIDTVNNISRDCQFILCKNWIKTARLCDFEDGEYFWSLNFNEFFNSKVCKIKCTCYSFGIAVTEEECVLENVDRSSQLIWKLKSSGLLFDEIFRKLSKISDEKVISNILENFTLTL
ncbi:MAG: hypothetical protein MHPSP_000984, partial [Paramarteilia canceri]